MLAEIKKQLSFYAMRLVGVNLDRQIGWLIDSFIGILRLA
jgi:hypothetical protein